MKILVRESNWLGDVVLTIPSLIAIHNRYPEARMVIAAREMLLPLFNLLPWETDVIPLGGMKSWISLRQENFDLAVVFPNSFRSALEVFLTRAHVRLGYSTCGRGLFLTERVLKDKGSLHHADYYYHLLRPLGIEGTRPNPELTIREKDKEFVSARLKEKGVNLARPLVAVSPGASYGEAKCWPEENFAGLIRRLRESAEIVFVGTRKDAPVIERIISLSKVNVFNLAGETSLSQLAGIFSISGLVISNDNGAMHLAALLGKNTICLFGPTDPLCTAPLGEKAIVLRDKVDCSPCKKRTCPDKKCFSKITVDRVYELAKGVL